MFIRKDEKLEQLLQQRKAPLTESGMQQVLQDLTFHIAGNVTFAVAVFPKADALSKIEIHAKDVEKLDLMQDEEGNKYIPVFTELSDLKNWKPTLSRGEFIYLVEKQDILNFLNVNEKVAAAVVNPEKDDLVLYRMQLQNLIQVGSQMYK